MRTSIGGSLAFLCLALISATEAKAVVLANRVFVSARSGNDANACDNINTPCQTFAGAVPKLNPGGEAIVLDSGGYGSVTITKSVTIEAPPGVLAFIHPSSPASNAVTINAGASDTVVLRGLVLNGGFADGIVANTFNTLHIENCVISGFGNDGIRITFNAASSRIFVKDTISRLNALSGIDIAGGRASIDHCRFEKNGVTGVFVEGAVVTIRDSVAAGNSFAGFEAFAIGVQSTVLNVYECMSTNNGDGLRAANAGSGFTIARVANSVISENLGVGLNNIGGGGSVGFESLGNNFVRGNIGGDTAGTITVILPK